MITLCLAMTLYLGPVDERTPAVDLGHSCHKVTAGTAKTAQAACTSQGAERCEVIVDPKGRVTLETKLTSATK